MSGPYWLDGDDVARGIAPDTAGYINTCVECGIEFDYREYNSDTCVECEDNAMAEKVKRERERYGQQTKSSN